MHDHISILLGSEGGKILEGELNLLRIFHNLGLREFFIHYADRIVFGTDLSSRLSLEEGRIRSGLVFRWLESEDTFPRSQRS